MTLLHFTVESAALKIPSLATSNAEEFTVASLRKMVTTLSLLTEEEFTNQLIDCNVLPELTSQQKSESTIPTLFSGLLSLLLEIKSKTVAFYEEYFALTEKHLQTAKAYEVNLTEKDVDVMKLAVYEGIQASPGDFVGAIVSELMLAYANPEYAEVRDILFLMILNESSAAMGSTNRMFGHNQPINLKEQADKTLEYVRSQSQIAVPPNIASVCQLFRHVQSVKNIFEGLSCKSAHINTKEDAINRARKYLESPHPTTNIDVLNAFYTIAKSYINRHKNPTRDRIFGIVNTNSWQIISKEIRTLAFVALEREINCMNTIEGKITRLQEARELPVFSEHRHNFTITGAWGRTDTVAKIDRLIEQRVAEKNGVAPGCLCC